MDDTLLSPEDIAERLGISRLTAVRWLRSGKLKGQKMGRKTLRMKASDLDAFINQQPPALTLVDTTAPACVSTQAVEQPIDAGTLALVEKLRQPGEAVHALVRRALQALQQAQDVSGPTPMAEDRQRSTQQRPSAGKGPMFSEQRRDILAMLRQHPEGLSPVHVRKLLGTDKDLGNTMKAMERDRLLRRIRPGLYAVADDLDETHGC